MKNRRALVGIVLALTIAVTFWFERRLQIELRTRNHEIQHHLEQARLRAGVEPHSEFRAVGESPSSSVQNALMELLRLRGQAVLIRSERDEMTRLTMENDQLRSNLLDRIRINDARLTPDQVQAFLESSQRNAASLLAAFTLTGDKTFLQEAVERHSTDPAVNLAAAVSDEFRTEQRRYLDAFKVSAPDNALADYLSALNYFKSGDSAQALEDLTAADGKPRMENYSLESVRAAEQAYSLAGYSEGLAKAAAWREMHGDQGINDMAVLFRSLRDLMIAYRQSGDEQSAQSALQMGLRLGQRLADEPLGLMTETQESVGLSIQRRLLETMDPASSYDGSGQTAKERLDQLAPRRSELNQSSDFGRWEGYFINKLSEQDLITYSDLLRNSGELEAHKWLADRTKTVQE